MPEVPPVAPLDPEAPTLPPDQVVPDPEATQAHVAKKVDLAPALGDFGDYELLSEVARGGMGIVFRARQKGLNRIVALKMILAGKLANAEEVKRFQIEAQAAARLQHPNIVAIYEVGAQDGHQFFSMEFISGQSLHRLLTKEVLPGQVAARYLEQIARALHYAHSKGVLHRDLKPANVLINEQDQPKLTDFGLAKVIEGGQDGAGPTQSGAIMGTPAYMSPEQASGTTRNFGPACDVYGAGAILYECLTGRPPFKGETALDTIMQVLHEEPLPPRLLNHKVDADLEKICMKCLAKDPAQRYPSAEALAEDLARYQRGEQVSARSVNVLERLTRELFHSQHDKQLGPWGVGLALFGCVILVAEFATSLLLWWRVSNPSIPEPVCYWAPRLVMILLMIATLYRFRLHASPWPTNAVERLIWGIWIGYVCAYASAYWALSILGHSHLEVYGVMAALAGLAWFATGGSVWGGAYVLGLCFMIAAPILATHKGSVWSPTWFGALWWAALTLMGLRYWRKGREASG
jgi:serine/threonine protein kinase